SRAHHLHVAGLGAALVAERILMGDRTVANVGDDLHVGMRMRRKAGVRRDLVIVPDAQRAVAHVLRVIVVGEREVMPGLEPAVIGAAELCKWFELDHVMLLTGMAPGARISTSLTLGYAFHRGIEIETIETHCFQYWVMPMARLPDFEALAIFAKVVELRSF